MIVVAGQIMVVCGRIIIPLILRVFVHIHGSTRIFNRAVFSSVNDPTLEVPNQITEPTRTISSVETLPHEGCIHSRVTNHVHWVLQLQNLEIIF
jgi:hypothetical protein